MRFYTVKEADGIIRIKVTVIRIGAKDSAVDNVAMDGEMATVDVDTSIINSDAINDYRKINKIIITITNIM